MVRHLMLQHVSKIAAVILFGNTADRNWEKNYSCINRMYCYETFTEEKFEEARKIAKRVKKHSKGEMWTVFWFDDFAGLCKGFFEKKEIQKVITTLKNDNIVLFFGAHRIKGQISTLGREMATNWFMGQTAEVNDLDEMWNMCGRLADNGLSRQEFDNILTRIPKQTFLHYDRANNHMTQVSAPNKLPKYRI